MPVFKHKLTARKIDGAPPGKYGDGDVLRLIKRSKSIGVLEYRYRLHGRDRTMGLGGWPSVSLAEARREHEIWRAAFNSGTDPITERNRRKRQADKSQTDFETIARKCFEAKKAELKGDGVNGRWMSPLVHHIFPVLGPVPVQDIDQRDLERVLSPIWHDKADTARKALNRVGLTLRHAAALGLDVDLQAPEKTKALLGKQRHTEKGHAYIAWQDLPALYAQLGETPADLALRLNILLGGGVRSFPIRAMRLEQIVGDVWTVPGEDMKGGKGKVPDFRVPLTDEPKRVLAMAARLDRGGHLFPGTAKAGFIHMNAMNNRMKALSGTTAHGLRKTFRTWAADTGKPFDVAETCIAHAVGNRVERSYQKSDLLDARRVLLTQWAGHVTGAEAQVITFFGAG